ncbi:MAG: DUF1540 domain-containing protein [Clostridia bacterium]|nr:DUF1540 domain-containing protein [Clostridia bacterium]
MKGLRCTTDNCQHNCHERCEAGIIDISQHGTCKSKIKREGGALSQLFEDYEAGPDYSMDEPELIVQCDADCIYNSNHLCTKEHVSVQDGLIATKCFSRKKDTLRG